MSTQPLLHGFCCALGMRWQCILCPAGLLRRLFVAVDPLQPKGVCIQQQPKKRSIGQYLQAYVQFMASPLHQDRSLKLLQYTLWMMGQIYSGSNNNSQRALEKLSLDLSWVRMANRFLQWPMAMEALWNDSWSCAGNSNTKFHQFLHKLLGKSLALSMVGYYPAEHGAYFQWMIPKDVTRHPKIPVAETLSFWSCRCWTVYIVTEVVQCLLQMSVASNWRVRQAVGILLPHLAEARGLDFFSSVLMEPSWMTLLLDPVSCVRQSIVQGVELLCKVAGADWINQTLLPAHEKLYNTHGYLIRVTILQAHAQVALAFKNPEEAAPAVDFIVKALSDKVPNVRMVAARGLGQVLEAANGSSSSSNSSKITAALQARMQQETDEDVRYALTKALGE